MAIAVTTMPSRCLSFQVLFTGFEVDDTDESSSNAGLSTQAWIAEIGLDITDRVNFAVQATPDLSLIHI